MSTMCAAGAGSSSTTTPTIMSIPTPTEDSHPDSNNMTARKYSDYVYTPNRKFAVILDSVLDITLDDYLRAITAQIGAVNITYASKIGRNRLCVYLNSEQAVSDLIVDRGIDVNDIFVGARRYVSASMQVVLSNVLPDIFDVALASVLKNYGQLVSPILPLHIGATSDKFKHVLFSGELFT